MARQSGLKISGIAEVRQTRRALERAPQALERELRLIGREVEQGSIARAPVDTGQLEATHHTSEQRRPGSLTINMFAGPALSPNGRDYTLKMHEGVYNLGPRSRAKNAGKTPHVGEGVGRKFMARSLQAVAKDAYQRLARAAGRAIRVVIRK